MTTLLARLNANKNRLFRELNLKTPTCFKNKDLTEKGHL